MASYTAEVSRTMMWEAARQWSQRWRRRCEREIGGDVAPKLDAWKFLNVQFHLYFDNEPLYSGPISQLMDAIAMVVTNTEHQKGHPKCPIFRRP